MQLIKVSHQKISASSLIGPAISQGRICSCQTIIHVLLMRAGPMISIIRLWFFFSKSFYWNSWNLLTWSRVTNIHADLCEGSYQRSIGSYGTKSPPDWNGINSRPWFRQPSNGSPLSTQRQHLAFISQNSPNLNSAWKNTNFPLDYPTNYGRSVFP